ncbi:CRISPR-associated endonuclease Cas2 [Succinimonas amylolytica]|uniref:CRISPR-associated endonuclease Cas2 n=1 Tax=Succinimonas amylolytica TaxID=83769 RepID=UPI00037E7C05|nr:CRISPR-associated endonuclease Cas2 [Succinimonas amylolytica]
MNQYVPKNDNNCVYALVIYDIQSDKLRDKFAKMMEGFGYRVQFSAFEVFLPARKFNDLLKQIPKNMDLNRDSVRVYVLRADGKFIFFGQNVRIEKDSLIIL